jgi:eukaryotic-like serine/threonine-protein kinase
VTDDSSSSGDLPWHPDPLGVVGRTISGRYQITGCLTAGGMGTVYLARHGGREVVVKLMTAAESPDGVLRFEREARSLAAVRHPNVVRIDDHGRCGDTGLLYIAMAWVRGETLKRHLRLWGPCTRDEFQVMAGQILSGVAEAHRRRVIHRDLKLSNVMVSSMQDGRIHVTLLDFGLSKVSGMGDPTTETHGLVGSPMTISPEQLRTGASDTRSDVYALGVLFYQMLTGRRPFSGKLPAVVFAQQATGDHIPMREALPADHDVPPKVVALIERCLCAEPSRRPRDASVLLRELDRALGVRAPDRTHVWGAVVLSLVLVGFLLGLFLLV